MQLLGFQPLGRKASACVATTDERRGRIEAQHVADTSDDRHAVVDLAGSRRVENGDDVIAPVAQVHRGGRSFRSAGRPLNPPRSYVTRVAHANATPRPGSSGRHCTPSTNSTRETGRVAIKMFRPNRRGRTDLRCAPPPRCRRRTRSCTEHAARSSARAACHHADAFAIPPDLASLT